MKYFKDPVTGEVFGYETPAARKKYGAKGLVPLTDEEVRALFPFSHPAESESGDDRGNTA